MRRPQSDEGWLKTKRRRAAARQGGLCYWCHLPMNEEPNSPLQVSLDHLVPKHDGGTSRAGNCVAAHRKCNSERHPEMNHRKRTGTALIATTGETAATSPFAVLKNWGATP